MREILFRGFCPNEQGKQVITVNCKDIQGDWVYGDLQHNICTTKIREQDKYIEKIAKSYSILTDTVCQYTGLTDKNGKKIFEHDRIKYKCGDIAKVIFTQYGAFVGVIESLSHVNIGGVLTEVIGTIFDKEEV